MARDSAALDYAKANLERGVKLEQSGYLNKDAYEQRDSAMRQAKAAMAIDQAALHTAEINLSYTKITAPFAGRLGKNQASTGALVTPSNSTLNTLVQLDPIYVTFNPSETDLAAIDEARAKGKIKADVYLTGDSKPRYSGELTFLDNMVDRSTGTIAARATIANTDQSLAAGAICPDPAVRSASNRMRCWCRASRSAPASSANMSMSSARATRPNSGWCRSGRSMVIWWRSIKV